MHRNDPEDIALMDQTIRNAEADRDAWRAVPSRALETIMSDTKSQRGGSARISVNDDQQLRDWSEQLGVTPDQLKQAVATVGDRPDAVEAYLKGEKGAARASRRRT
jgi:hypothetical protein